MPARVTCRLVAIVLIRNPYLFTYKLRYIAFVVCIDLYLAFYIVWAHCNMLGC